MPVGLSVRGRVCVVVGGGNVGARKVVTLVKSGARVIAVDPLPSGDLVDMAREGAIRLARASFEEGHLDDAFLVVAATDDDELNAEIARLARLRGALVCDASSADRSDVIFGALLADGGNTVAVFTDGRDPSKARRTRDRIAELMGPENEGSEAG
jgi:precorrin-2 dehydrogenase/sirohydrochlorin ferrochelatase